MKTVSFNISIIGLCADCDSKVLFTEKVPDNWLNMTEDEQHAWAKETFWENAQWGWWENEEVKNECKNLRAV